MKRIIFVVLGGLFLIFAVVGVYYLFVGFNRPLSSDGEDWSRFGEYFGGVAGPLLSFISIILLVYTIHLQSEQLSDAQHETLKRDLLVHVIKADDEIEHWLRRKLATVSMTEQTVEFGDVVWGLLPETLISPKEFKPAVGRLHKLTSLYCEALALYRDNINSFFVFKYHQQKARYFLQFLEGHLPLLDQMAGPSLKLCRVLLDGNEHGDESKV